MLEQVEQGLADSHLSRPYPRAGRCFETPAAEAASEHGEAAQREQPKCSCSSAAGTSARLPRGSEPSSTGP